MKNKERQDVYTRVTAAIIADLEKGVRPWVKPWNAEHAAGRITRPLRHNGQPYSGINILMLWTSATAEGFVAPIWMTYRQAQELKGQVRKGEKGSLVVYANAITRTETDEATGEESEREIHPARVCCCSLVVVQTRRTAPAFRCRTRRAALQHRDGLVETVAFGDQRVEGRLRATLCLVASRLTRRRGPPSLWLARRALTDRRRAARGARVRLTAALIARP